MSNNAEKIFDNMENLDRELEESKNKYTSLSRKMRIYIFSLFLILSITADLEHIQFIHRLFTRRFKHEQRRIWFFCINSHTGKMVGIIFFMFVLNLRHRKYTLVIAVFFQGSSYVLYQITSNIYLLNFAKMFASGTKVCGTLYRSIGIEQFGLSKYKSVFFSLVQVVSTYGQIIGFTLNSLLFKRNWRMGLLSILVLIYTIDFGFLLVLGKYFF